MKIFIAIASIATLLFSLSANAGWSPRPDEPFIKADERFHGHIICFNGIKPANSTQVVNNSFSNIAEYSETIRLYRSNPEFVGFHCVVYTTNEFTL
jgi:hypothetical protein